MSRQLAASDQPLPIAPEAACAVSMWDYVVPAGIGGATGLLTGFGVRYLMRREHPTTQDAAAHIVEGAVTLLVGGLTFILWLRRPRGLR
ncbi:MAG: hypothetical protein A2Y38_01395 [Spirochaetes bacterium GWB1_59_5]|nr:MAG: hypothetical protein A2Y38_01395 [Spirochaetes bacterium GWB1_59_5]